MLHILSQLAVIWCALGVYHAYGDSAVTPHGAENLDCGYQDARLNNFGKYSKDKEICVPESGDEDGCIVFPMKWDEGKDILYNASIFVSPFVDGFKHSAITDLTFPADDIINYVSLRDFEFFVDSGADTSCFGSVVDTLIAKLKPFDIVSPYYFNMVRHGNLVDLQMAVNMIFKIGDLPPFSHSMLYGCPAKTERYSKYGVIGKDLISKLGIRLELSQAAKDGKMIIYRSRFEKTKNFLYKYKARDSKKKYWRPFGMTVNIEKLVKDYDLNASIINKEFWNHSQSWKKVSAYGGLSIKNKLDLITLMTGKRMDYSVQRLPVDISSCRSASRQNYTDAIASLAVAKLGDDHGITNKMAVSYDDHFESFHQLPYDHTWEYLQQREMEKETEKEQEKKKSSNKKTTKDGEEQH